jgi:transposase
VAPWWPANSKEAYNTGLDGLARALENWSKSRSGERAGATVGFPKFKTKHRAARPVRFTTGAIRVEPDHHHVALPRVGRVRTHESTRKLARRLEGGTARILSATVRFTGGRWQCAFQVIVAGKTADVSGSERGDQPRPPRRPHPWGKRGPVPGVARPPATRLATDVEPTRRPAPPPPRVRWGRQEAMKRQPRTPIKPGTASSQGEAA